uniref:Neprosin activation peptide domain-containing protein n=1 Tax=Setaria digitata TaxID=48799 RepID=A0A915PP46_9BILA
MWEGRPIDCINGWPIFENGSSGISMSTSMVMSCSSPKLSAKENHTNSLQHRRYSENIKVSRLSDDMPDNQVII